MDMRRTRFVSVAGLGLALVAAPASAQAPRDPDLSAIVRDALRDAVRSVGEAGRSYQGRNTGPEQTDKFSAKYRVGRDGRVSIANIAGDITVTAGPGEDVTVDAVKRTRGDQSQLASVHIEASNGPGRVDIRTIHTGRNDRVSVDYTVTVPTGASLEVHSVSGSLKVTGVHGVLRAETISGAVTATDTPKLENAHSISGTVTISGISTEGDLIAGSVSGSVVAKSVKVRRLEVGSISGDLSLTDVTCERLAVKTVSGSVEYAGGLAKGGTYDFNIHSGSVRLMLANPAGFALTATSFSGSVRSELPMTIGGDSSRDTSRDTSRDRRRREVLGNHSLRATYGDGSSTLTIHTFSGDIIISKR
jgi:DUF4097 and DUF4098 domain-containing protein YvlB